MYQYQIKKLLKSTIEVIIDIPKADLEEEKKQAFKNLAKDLVVDGYRKGKVPEAIAKNYIKNERIFEEAVKTLLSRIYSEIIEKENLKPIINPKIDFIKAKDKEDWKIKITLAEKPLVKLNNYKEAIKKLKADKKKTQIWVPGKDKEKTEEKQDQNKLINEILETVLKETKVEISDLIIENELEYRLSRLVDDINKIGLTVDAYLKSKNLTLEQLKESYKKEIEDTYKLEFVLAEIADKENIVIESEEINKILANIKDEKERAEAQKNNYIYASILRKQKIIDFLINL